MRVSLQEVANNAVKKLGFSPTDTMALCDAFANHTVIRSELIWFEMLYD